MDIIITQLLSQYGEYYEKQEQNMDRLYKVLRQKLVTPTYASKKMTNGTQYKGSLATVSEVIQPFQRTFTAKGQFTFVPRTIQLYNLKVDTEFYPDDIKASWLGFLADLENQQDRTKWPFIRYIMEVHLPERIAQDMETKEYYKGIFVEPTEGVAGAAGTSMNGIQKTLRQGVIDGKVYDWAFGNFTTANIFDMVEKLADSLGDEWEGVPAVFAMSPYWIRQYLRDRRNTLGANQDYVSGKITVDYRENVQLIGLPSMGGTNDAFLTTKPNFIHVTRINGQSPFQVEGQKRLVSIYTDWWEALDFEVLDPTLVYYHDASETSGT